MKPQTAISALFALDGALLGGWMSHLPDAQRNLHLTAGELGLTLLASSVGALSMMPFTGTLIHRFGSRRLSVALAVLVLCIVPLLILAPSRLLLALTLFCMGATNGTLDVAMNAHSMAVQARMDRPILSAVHGWFCIGGFLAAGGTALANEFGVAPSLHLILASVLLAGVLVALFPGLLPDGADQGEEGARFTLPKGRLLALGLLTMLSFFAEGTLWDWSAVYFRSELRTTAALAALGFGVGAGSMAVGRMFGDSFVHRLGAVQALRTSGLLTAAGLFFAVALNAPVGTFLGFAAAGLGLANTVPILFSAAARYPGLSSGAGLAAVTSLGYGAFLGGPPLIGHVADLTSLRASFTLVATLTVLIALLGPWALGEATKD